MSSADRSSEVQYVELLTRLNNAYQDAARELNAGLQRDQLKVTVDAFDPQRAQHRFALYNASKAITVRGLPEVIEVFLLPIIDLVNLPQAEYSSRLRFRLERPTGGRDWFVDTSVFNDDALRLLVLSTLNDLLRDVSGPLSLSPAELRLAIGGTSITTAIRELMNDRQRLVVSLVDQQESIFKRLSHDIHDQAIGDLMLLLRGLDTNSVNEEDIRAAVERSVQELRSICEDLSSRELRDWGLQSAMCELAGRLSIRSGLSITYSEHSEVPIFPYDVDLQIYRIVQEALTNAIKHSGAESIEVSSNAGEKEFCVEVRDDGRGIKASDSGCQKRAGLGLRIMKERAEMIMAQGFPSAVSIQSRPGFGTIVSLHIELGV